MQQYSPKNQALILTQCPEATDCKGMRAWNKEGRQIVKGSKALRIFTPTGMAFVFDVSQTEPAKANTGKQARRVAATMRQAAQDAEYDLYCDNIAGMDNPPSFEEWQRVQQEAALMWEEALNQYDVALAAD